jgi:hypothetical protein
MKRRQFLTSSLVGAGLPLVAVGAPRTASGETQADGRRYRLGPNAALAPVMYGSPTYDPQLRVPGFMLWLHCHGEPPFGVSAYLQHRQNMDQPWANAEVRGEYRRFYWSEEYRCATCFISNLRMQMSPVALFLPHECLTLPEQGWNKFRFAIRFFDKNGLHAGNAAEQFEFGGGVQEVEGRVEFVVNAYAAIFMVLYERGEEKNTLE